jgi:DNA mismatch repair protein MutL
MSSQAAQRIVVMPANLASQIAAGEVVERPASAVKELVENAIDAGATRCDVEIDGGGVTRIVVSDDGHGMNRADATLSVERHATSKLFSVADLGRVTTFGFRGEALPSIASVSRISIRTRTKDEDAGTLVVVEGGQAATVSSVGAPVGTTVEVHDLFFNVAPRRKFLRSAATESGHVADVLEAAALARPDLTFTLTRDGRKVREWLREEGRSGRTHAVLGDGLAECRGERGPLRVEAYLSRPEYARAGAAGLRFLVNGRPVRDRALLMTVAQAYGSVLERGRYPKGVVYLDLSPALVDVNVHPQKGEVRFADHRAATDAVYYVLSRELARAFSLPEPARSPWTRRASSPAGFVPPSADGGREAAPQGQLPRPPQAAEAETAFVGNDSGGAPEASEGTNGERADVVQRLLAVADPRAPSPFLPSPAVRWTSLRFIAQVRQTYLVCEGEEGLYVIDQHAAAERVNFDRLRKQYRSRAVPSQALLFPITLTVRPEDAELVEAKTEDFGALGLDLRVRGVDVLSVHAVPKLLVRASPEQLVRDLVAEVSRSGHRAFSDTVDLALATMACHGSIRAGDAIASTEASALLAALDYADFAGHCPHGRPVVAFMSFKELERKVGRR